MDLSTLVWMTPLAVILDLGMRYPHIPHPVSLAGNMLDALEKYMHPLAARCREEIPLPLCPTENSVPGCWRCWRLWLFPPRR